MCCTQNIHKFIMCFLQTQSELVGIFNVLEYLLCRYRE